jgi:outer membrane protein assembly factor BamE (lipoprotein component of BamABCDE complex)
MKKLLLLSLILLASCSLNKVVKHHGVHNLEVKQSRLKINQTNKNEIINLIGPPSTKSTFDNEVYIYIERKTSSAKITKLGKKQLLRNNVLVLEINNRGILLAKNFYNLDDMNMINFEENITSTNYTKNNFIYNFLTSLRQKINDPLGNKRIKN